MSYFLVSLFFFSQLWITLSVNVQDEKTNAGMALACQMADSLLVLAVRPYVETSTDIAKGIGELSNMLTYLAVTLPILADFETPKWMGDLTQIVVSMAATTIAAIVALKAPLVLLIDLANKAAVAAACCFSTPSVGGILGASKNQATTIVLTNLNDDAADRLKERLHRHSSDPGRSVRVSESGSAEAQVRSLPGEREAVRKESTVTTRNLEEGGDSDVASEGHGSDSSNDSESPHGAKCKGGQGGRGGREGRGSAGSAGQGRGGVSSSKQIALESHSKIKLESDLCFVMPSYRAQQNMAILTSEGVPILGAHAPREVQTYQDEEGTSGRTPSFYGISRNVPVMSSSSPRDAGGGAAGNEGNVKQDNGGRWLPQRAISFSIKQHTTVEIAAIDLALNGMDGYGMHGRRGAGGVQHGGTDMSISPYRMSPLSANISGDIWSGNAESTELGGQRALHYQKAEQHDTSSFEHGLRVQQVSKDLGDKIFARRFMC